MTFSRQLKAMVLGPPKRSIARLRAALSQERPLQVFGNGDERDRLFRVFRCSGIPDLRRAIRIVPLWSWLSRFVLTAAQRQQHQNEQATDTREI